jgi:hypothetical protein
MAWNQRTFLTQTQKNFEYLVSKEYTLKINVIDNQGTKAMQSNLTPQQCHLQLVHPGNHHVNAAESPIETFIYCFIGAFGTMEVDFPIQL